MLQGGWLPVFGTLGDDLVVNRDNGAQDLGFRVFQTEGRVKEEVVLKGLLVHVVHELANFFVKIDFGFDAANIIREDDWEDGSNLKEGDARFVVVFLVEEDVESLVLGKVSNHERILLTVCEEPEDVGSAQTSSCYRLGEVAETRDSKF